MVTTPLNSQSLCPENPKSTPGKPGKLQKTPGKPKQPKVYARKTSENFRKPWKAHPWSMPTNPPSWHGPDCPPVVDLFLSTGLHNLQSMPRTP